MSLTDVDFATEFDLGLEPGCEFVNHVPLGHTGPAFYVVKFACFHCPRSYRFLMCIECFVQTQAPDVMIECAECASVAPGSEVIRLVHIL